MKIKIIIRCAVFFGLAILSTENSFCASQILILDDRGGVSSGNWEIGDANPRGDAYPFGSFAYWGSFGGGTMAATTPYGKAYCAAVNYYGLYEHPYYRANMDAYASRSIDLRASLNATLRFYYAIPSIDNVDLFKVLVDNTNVVFNTSSPQSTWREVNLSLTPWINGIHALTFRFVSSDTNSKVPYEGAYLERISVSVTPVQPETFILSNAFPFCLTTPSEGPVVDLYWSASNGADHYEVYRNGQFRFGGIQGTSFRDTTVRAGSNYSYQVLAWNAASTAWTNSNQINVTVPANICTPILSVIPAQQTVSSLAGNARFSVTNIGGGTMRYSASITGGSDSLAVLSGAAGTNAGSLTLASGENLGLAERVGYVTVTASNLSGVAASGSPQTVSIIQAARSQPGIVHVDCSYSGGNSEGSPQRPFRTVTSAYQAALLADTLRISSCDYCETLTLSKPLRLEATNGIVNIGCR